MKKLLLICTILLLVLLNGCAVMFYGRLGDQEIDIKTKNVKIDQESEGESNRAVY